MKKSVQIILNPWSYIYRGPQPDLTISSKSRLLFKNVSRTGSSAANPIDLTSVTKSRIDSPVISGGKKNISLTTCTNIDILNSTLTNPGGAFPAGQQIQAIQSSYINIRGGVFTLTGIGTPEDQISIYRSNNCVVEGCTVTGYGVSLIACGIILDGTAGAISNGYKNIVRNCICTNQTDGSTHGVGIGVASGYGHTIDGNTVTGYGNAGIYVFDSYPYLIDDFSAAGTIGSPGTKWTNFGTTTTPAVTGGNLVITLSATGDYGGVVAISAVNFTNTGMVVRMRTVPNQAGNDEVQAQLQLDANNIVFFQQAGSLLNCKYTVGGVTSQVNSFPYNNTTHQYLRLREYKGTIFWDTSADRITWTNQASLADPFAVTALRPLLIAGTYAAQVSPGTAVFDDVEVSQMCDITVTNNTVGGANKCYLGNMLGAVAGTYPNYTASGNNF